MSVHTTHRCLECDYEAPSDADAWATVEHPPLGELTQCPECGSTNVHTV